VSSHFLVSAFHTIGRLREELGMPAEEDLPESSAYVRRRRGYEQQIEKRRKSLRAKETVCEFVESEWTTTIREWQEGYGDWCQAIHAARKLAVESNVTALLDAGEPRIRDRWTSQAVIKLDRLAGSLSPVILGVTGMGVLKLPELPTGFMAAAKAVIELIDYLRAIPATAAPSPSASNGDDNSSERVRLSISRSCVGGWKDGAYTRVGGLVAKWPCSLLCDGITARLPRFPCRVLRRYASGHR